MFDSLSNLNVIYSNIYFVNKKRIKLVPYCQGAVYKIIFFQNVITFGNLKIIFTACFLSPD